MADATQTSTQSVTQDEVSLRNKLEQPVATTASKDPRLAELGEDIRKAEAEPLPTVQKVDMPKAPNAPIVNQGEWQKLGLALVGMAMMSGAAKGNWMAAGQFLNGAMQGYTQGHEELARDNFQKYQEQLKVAMDQQNQRNQEYRELLNNRKLSINEMISQYRTMSAEDGRADQISAANTRSIAAMDRALASQEMMMERITAARDKAHDSMEGSGNTAIEGDTLAWMYFLNGKTPQLPYGKSPERQAYIQGLEHVREQLGMSQPEFAAMAGSNAARTHAMNSLAQRSTMIDAASNSAIKNMDAAIEAAKKVGLSDIQVLNKAVIAGKIQAGNADVTDYQIKLQTALREYAKVASGSIGASGLTDSQIREVNSTLSNASSIDQLIAARNAIATDMGNVASSYKDQMGAMTDVAKALETRASGEQPAAAPAPAQPQGNVVDFSDWAKGHQ